MAQQDDNIKKLYDELQSTYDVGSEDDFRNYLNNAEHRKALYNELKNDYDIQDEKAFDDYLGYINGEKALGTTKVGSVAQQVVNEYDQSAKDNAEAEEDLSAATSGAKIGGNISFAPAKPNNQQTVQLDVDNTAKSVMDASGTPAEQAKVTGPKTQFVSEDPNYVSGTPKEEALKKYPWMQPDQVYLWNKTTKEPVVTYVDESGQAVTDEDLQIKKAKSEITGQDDTEYMYPEAAALQLPNGNTTGLKIKKGALTQMADEILRKEYGDNYLNTQFGRDGNVYTGAERRDLGAQQLYDELNSDVRNARISFAVADEKDRNEILSRIKAKWGKVADANSIINAVNDENAAKRDIDIVAQQNINELNAEIQEISQQMDLRGAEIDNASSPFVDQTFNARDVDPKYRILQSKLNYAQNALKSWENVKNSGSLDALAGFKDAVMDISAWDFGFSDLKNAVSLLTAKGKDKQELVNLYGRSAEAAKFEDKYNPDSYRYGKIAGTSIPYALQFAGTDGGFKSIGSALSKKATSIAEKYALEGLKKQVVKGLGVAVGDIARAYTMSGTVQGLNTISDILTRSAGELTVDKQGNYQLKSDEPLLESIYKGVTASAIQNFTEMVGESVNISANLMRMLPKIGLGRVSNAITKIGTQDWYRVCNNWLSRAGVNDFGGEVLEEELSIILNAAFVGDNPLLNGSGGLLDVRTQKDILGGMLYSISAMRAGALAMYGVKKGVGSAFVKTLDMYDKMQLNQSDKGGQSIFGEGWTEIKDEIDNTPNDKVNAVIEKLAKEHPSKDEQSAIIDYAVKLLKTRGHNLGIAMASDGENDEGAQEEIKDMPDLSQPNAEYLNKDDGMIHKASLYPDASDPTGTAKDVFIIKGNLVTNEDGSINKDASDDTIIYIDGNGERHIASPDKFAAAYPPMSNNEVLQANEGGENEEAQTTTFNKGDEVNINVDGNNYTATIQGTDGFGNYNVYYEDEIGMMHPAKFTADQLNEMNGKSTVSNGQQATSEQPADVQQQVEQPVVEQPAQQEQETQLAQQAQEEQKPAIPKDEKGNMLYHQVPVETTIKDLYDGKLDDNEIRDFVDVNISEADKNLDKINKKAPKIGTNKDEYLKKKQEWQKQVEDATRIRDYWNSVKDYIAQQTHTTPEEVKAAQDELSGEAARREYQDMGGSVPDRTEEVESATEGLTSEDADNLLSAMEARAEVAPDIELTPTNWVEQFGEDGMVDTPIGKVKMGENQIAKLFTKERSSQFGMIRPTLTNPDVIVEVPSSTDSANDVERPTSLLFIKAFLKNDGSKVYYFKSVTVKKDGLEVSVSSHLDRKKRVEDALRKGKLQYRFDGGAQTEHRPANVSVTTPLAGQGASSKGNATRGDQSASDVENGALVSPQLASSESKDTQTSANEQTINDKINISEFSDNQRAERIDNEEQPTVAQNDSGKAIGERLWRYVNFLNNQYGYNFEHEETFAKWITKKKNNIKWLKDKFPPNVVKEVIRAINDYNKLLTKPSISSKIATAEAETEVQAGVQGIDENAAAPEEASGERIPNIERGRQGYTGYIARRQQNNLETSEEINVPLSQNEQDEYGNPMVLAENGSTVFGTIESESGLTEAPIKLSLGENKVGTDGKNHGYGLLHIEAGHGEQIRNAGYQSVEQFVENVAQNYTDIKEGALIGKKQTYLLEVSDEHNNTLFIQLSNDGTYWNVNSAGIFKKKYSRRKPLIYTVPAVGKSTVTDTSEVNSGQSMGATAPAGNSSESKDSDKSAFAQTIGEKITQAEAETEQNPTDSTGGAASNSEIEVKGKPSLLDVVHTLYTKGKVVASKLFQRSFFDVAQTPKFMKGLGLRGNKFTIRYGVIARHFNKDNEHDLSEEIWEQLPNAIQTPFAITKYFADESHQEQKGYRLYTTLQLSNGSYVVVSAEVKNSGRDLEVNAINTIFGRNVLSSAHDELIYISERITPEQQSLLDGNNPRQYSAERELSVNKDNEFSDNNSTLVEKISKAEEETDVNPTEGQKEAGNYKKGHVRIDGYDITIEQPKGSVRRGTDADGKQWEQTMNNTYGYIRGTEGVDGDHIDIFLSDNPTEGNVYVVDQVNPDGSFDEHKVMYGFQSAEDARAAYLSNYEEGWQGLGTITEVSKDEFKKWINSSHRKTKPFAEYKSVNGTNESNVTDNPNITPGDLLRAYESGDTKAIEDAENRMRTFIENSDDKKAVAATYFRSKDNSRKYKDVSSDTYRTQSFIAETCKKALLKAGMPKEAFMSERKRSDFASNTSDSRILDVMSSDPSFDVLRAVVNNPSTSNSTLQLIADHTQYSYLADDARRILAERDGGVRQMLGETGEKSLSAEETAIRDAVVGRLRESGLEVITDAEEGQRVLDEANGKRESRKRKSANNTALPKDESFFKGTVILFTDTANIRNNLETLASDYEKINNPSNKNVISELGRALNATHKGSGSQYVTIEAKNGNIVTIRLAGHNVSVERMDNAGRDNAISIVISRKSNEGVQGEGKAHVVEYFYPDKSIRKAGGEAIASIARSLQQALYSGEYKDTTGLAEVEEVNGETIREQRVYHGSGADFEAFDHSHMGEGVRTQAMLDGLAKAANMIQSWIKGNKRGRVFTIELPESTQRKIKEAMGRDLDSHNITANGIAHALKNHGVKGNKLNKNSIPLREEDAELIPYIMTAPDYVKKASADVSGRESVRFYKELSNGYVVVVEKEYKNSPDDMETITMWAETSSEATNARQETVPDTHVQNAILSTDAAKIRKDAETAIENDRKIREQRNVRFFRTPNGEAYGFTVGGRIYVDPRVATADTPIHEYAHLWASALRQGNPEEWQNVVGLMKDTPVWDEVRRRYPELTADDDIADEVLATYSGRRGAERLKEETRKAVDGKGVFEAAQAVTAMERVKEALRKFWKGVADFLHIHYRSAEEVADRVMSDLLEGRTLKDSKEHDDTANFAKKHNLNEKDVEDYADYIRRGNLNGASRAFKEIRRKVRLDNQGASLGQFAKIFSPIEKELYERFGNIDELRQQYVQRTLDERNAMEAARKKAEEEAEKERRRQQEFQDMSSEQLDAEYMKAVEANDKNRMRDLVNEAARRNGYGDINSGYQGVGAWTAPSNPGYESEEERRKALESDGTDVNVMDVAEGYSGQPNDYFTNLRAYGNDTPHGKESAEAINTAVAEVREGKKPTIKVYRAVPKTVKEGKLRNGDWVTPSRKYAEMHGDNRLEGDYRIIEQDVPAEHLWWDGNDINEWGFDDGQDYAYRNTRNNRKLNELITRDDKGNIIPLSQRFNARRSDVRFRFIGEKGAARLDAAEEATSRLDNLSTARQMEEAYNEKKARIEKLKDSKPVEITGKEIEPSDDLKQYKKNALEYGKKLQGSYVNKDTGRPIQLQRGRRNGGVNEVLQHDYKDVEHLQSVAAIPQIIENSIYIGSRENTDKEKNPNVTEYQYYVCGLKIGNVDYTVRSTIAVDNKGNRYYDHKLTSIEKGKLLDQINGQTAKNVGFGTTPGTKPTTDKSLGKDKVLLSLLQTNDEENARKIKFATGWERGADGKWRYETPDFEYYPNGDARKNDKYKETDWYNELHGLEEKLFNGETLTDEETKRFDELSARVNDIRDNDKNMEHVYLDDYIRDDELFKAYPELKLTRIDFVDIPNARYSARYNEEENRITLNLAKSIDDKSAIAHELQHAIQRIEGFARGSNVDNYRNAHTSENVILDIIHATDGRLLDEGGFDNTPEGIFNALNRKTTYGTILRDYSSELDDIANKYGYETIFDLVNDIDKFKSSVEMYLSEAGEVEARNVEARINMTPEERRQSLASETEDVAREDQLFIYDNLGVSARQGTGALTDSELSNANDPAGKMLGKPSRTPAQQRAFAARERQRMADRAREVADILHLDNVEIVTDASTLQGRRAKAKGFYSRDNGKIVIVVPNHVDMADIEQTVLHEAVAHYGLRKLFGSNFDTFLYNVYNNADMDVRDKIAKLAEGHNWDFATATEEYLASLAEKTNFEDLNASWWDKIKSLFLKLLHSIGLKGFAGVSLTDNELRYILWRSYENLKNPGRYRSIIDEAKDITMQNELRVGNYSAGNSEAVGKAAENGVVNIEDVNRRFNEELGRLTEENAQSVILNLGRPGNFLLASGLSDRPIKLYGNKLLKKMRKHGFTTSDVKNLPKEINNPIAVFKGSVENSFAILTELEINGNNVLASISVGKGNDIDFNIISSVYGKNGNSVVSWINDGKILYVNKEKALNYLRISAPIAEAQDNQELSSAANIVKNFENPNISEENMRYGNGALAASESNGINKTNETNGQEAEEANRRFNEELNAFKAKTHKGLLHLGQPGRILNACGINEELTLSPTVLSRKLKQHGLNVDDIKGLAGAIQEPILVYQHGDAHPNMVIVTDLAAKGGKVSVAVELDGEGNVVELNNVSSVHSKGATTELERLSNMRDGYLEQALRWVDKNKVSDWLGIADLNSPIHANNPKLVSIANILQNFENPSVGEENILYREAKKVEKKINSDWRDEYDKKLSKFSFKLTEAAQDAMRSVKILQDIIAKETSAPIRDDENVYWRENRLSSVNKYEQEYYNENYCKPIVTEIANLVKYGARYNDKGEDIINSDNDVLKYLIAKSGLERNQSKREVEAMNARKPYEDQIKELQKQVEKEEIKEENANKKIAKLQEQADKAEMNKRVAVLHKDYSGLTELFQDEKDFDTLATSYVSDFEKKFDTESLWNAINRATKETLRKAFVDGLISRESYESTAKMYKYYIPLRGWANDVASEAYNYKGSGEGSRKILQTAKGRTSLADNPISEIGRMMQDAIFQGNRNRMKQAVYNLAMNHDTSLLNIKRQWYQNMGTEEDPAWERVFPDLNSDMTAEQVAEEVEEFESRMRELKKEGRATQSRKGLILRLHTTKREEAQHRISVAINGKEYNIFVNGNPRAAQAINGELNDVDRYGSAVAKVNRFLSQVYTSINPEFVVTNYQRDAGFAASIVASTEPLSYQKEWAKNMTVYNPITTGVYLNRLIKKAKTGNINPNNKAERYMQEFLSNGGETGFTNMLSADDYKKQIKRDIKSINSVVSLPKAARAAVAFTERANTVFEDATRYATYVTSREQGRTIDRSIRDAKEISLNFNTRGADGLPGDSFIYRFFRGLRRWMIFVNPSIQGLNKAGMAFRNHPLRSSMMIAGLPTLLGYALPAIMRAVVGGGDGDDDDKNVIESYKDLPKWVRRTNIAIPIGENNFVTIPLSYELRVSYGLGEMMWEYGEGMIDGKEMAAETLLQLSDLLPVSLFDGTLAQSISPTIARPFVDIIQNRNFYGKKIYNDSQFIEGYPEYMKAYAGTPKWLVKSTEVLNNIMPKFGADVSDKYTPGLIDLNPAMIDYLLSSYLGGLYNLPSKFGKTISMIWDEDMRDIQNVPILSRNWKNSQSGNPYNSGDRYKTYMKEYDLSKQRFNGYKKEAKNDVPEFLNSLKDLLNTPSGKRMLMIDAYKRGGLDKLNRRIRDIDTYGNEKYEGEKDALTKKRDGLKEELINKLDSISDGTLDFVNGEWTRK